MQLHGADGVNGPTPGESTDDGENTDTGSERPLRYEEIEDPEFQKKWREARHLSGEEVELAFRHGFDCARYDSPNALLGEVEGYLRQSWDAMAPPVDWDQVSDIVRSGYERYKGCGVRAVDQRAPRRCAFPYRTIGGSSIGGTMGERSFLGGVEPVSDYNGEGGPPVEDGRRVRDVTQRSSSTRAPRRAPPPA